MPSKPRARCAEPGCPAFVTSGRCPLHRVRRPPRQRASSVERGYGTEHRAAREALLGDVCERCGRSDVPLQLGHVVAAADGGLPEPSNYTTLCGSCNVTQAQADTRRRRGEP